MSKNSSARYYQENKERLQQYDCERYKNLPEDEKQNVFECRKKCNIINIRKYFHLENFVSLLRQV